MDPILGAILLATVGFALISCGILVGYYWVTPLEVKEHTEKVEKINGWTFCYIRGLDGVFYWRITDPSIGKTWVTENSQDVLVYKMFARNHDRIGNLIH